LPVWVAVVCERLPAECVMGGAGVLLFSVAAGMRVGHPQARVVRLRALLAGCREGAAGPRVR
jgi:hypothetical protein